MGRLFGVVGEMSESDRHVLMRQALRAKHLRFLHDHPTVGRSESEKPAIHDREPPVDESRRAPVGEQFAKPETGLETLPKSSEVLRRALRNVGHGANLADSHQAGPPPANDSPIPTKENAPKEVFDILNLRRLLDSGKLTQQEYLDRLHWR